MTAVVILVVGMLCGYLVRIHDEYAKPMRERHDEAVWTEPTHRRAGRW